ncbi:MAG: hypothetical protein AB1898_32120 [Acidobacteriota bacterium]
MRNRRIYRLTSFSVNRAWLVINLALTITMAFRVLQRHLSAVVACGATDGDCFVQPELWHRLSDKLCAALGSNILVGRHQTPFVGQMAKNDNLYSSVRVDF